MKIYKIMDNGVKIVEYDDTMAAAVADMWNKSGDSWGGSNSSMTAEQVIADYSGGGSYFNIFIALDGDEAVGLCSFDRYYKDADTTYVHVLNVRPDYHGKKVGKELVLACVNKTIEMGYPRVDIHTWAGNTKAVPLYKKCGFIWEDRADTTHLSNYIPTVLKTELFEDFFKTADWYKDSTKVIEIKPDGVKINKFETAGYSWQKDGKNLAVGFEKTGRRMRYIETDDYKIEFIADNHELAFGLNHECIFKFENKSGKELNIKIVGKNDKGIKFDCEFEQTLTDKFESFFNPGFYVEPITEEIDTWRMHPCVLADVYINGKHAEFGLGIEPKFPLEVKFIEKRQPVVKPGMVQDVYINVKSSFPKKATVKFTVPDSNTTRFTDNDFTIETEPDASVMLRAKAEILNCGYEKLDVNYSVLTDGENKTEINFFRPLHLINQGTEAVFSYELDYEYAAVNGLWKLTLNKRDNSMSFFKSAGHGNCYFRVPKFGKPFTDEFDLMKPSDVRIYNNDNIMLLEADYNSDKYKGALLTVINEFNATGVIYRRYKVTNKSQNPMQLYLRDQYWSSAARRAIFSSGGEIHEITDNSMFGFSDMPPDMLDENWVFDNSQHNKSGMYWDKSYKPVTKWGDEVVFEHDTGKLMPDEVFETKANVYMSGIFNNFMEFRNYVLGINEETALYTSAPLDININNRNPFITTDTEKIKAVVKNNRLKIYGGDIKFTSPDGLFKETMQTNPEDETVKSNDFDLDISDKNPAGVYTAEIDFDFQIWKKNHKRALFVSDKSSKVQADEKDGVYTINNGKICFKTSLEYSDAVYSLKYGDNEWLYSKYPNHEPYAWWNPFIGGINVNLWRMNANLALREKRTTEFVTLKDNFGTEWTGVKTIVSINEFAEYKGVTYEQYYLTQPSLPVLCVFVKFINNTGEYRHIGYEMNAFLSGKDNISDIYAVIRDEKEDYCLRMGGDTWSGTDRFVKISHERKSKRDEKLYVFTDTWRNRGGIGVGSDINQGCIWTEASANIETGDSIKMRPVFFMFTEKELTLDSVCDLERIVF